MDCRQGCLRSQGGEKAIWIAGKDACAPRG